MVNIRRVLLEHRHHAQVVPGAGHIAVIVSHVLRGKFGRVRRVIYRDSLFYLPDFAARV